MNSHQLKFMSMLEIERTAIKLQNSRYHESTQITERKKTLINQNSGGEISNRYATSSDLKFNAAAATFNDTLLGSNRQSFSKTKPSDKLRGSSLFTFHNDKEMQTQYNLKQIKEMNFLKDELKFH